MGNRGGQCHFSRMQYLPLSLEAENSYQLTEQASSGKRDTESIYKTNNHN